MGKANLTSGILAESDFVILQIAVLFWPQSL